VATGKDRAVSTQDDWPEDLDDAVTSVHRGPLEDFVARRDALVKELRGGGRADDAKRVKALRKPSRTAWALDAAVHEDPRPVERLAAAVTAVIETQSEPGADVRGATDQLRAAARDLAAAAATASAGAGHRVDPSGLVPAVLAVIGDAGAFEALRRGRLTDVPSGGGLDVLSLPPPRPAAAPLAAVPGPGPEGAGGADVAEEPEADPAAVAAARDEVTRAEAAADQAHRDAERAEEAVDDAEAALDAAEERLRQAEQEARTARDTLRQAQQDARTARRQAREADSAASRARGRLRDLTG
jgi:hypothetical protein